MILRPGLSSAALTLSLALSLLLAAAPVWSQSGIDDIAPPPSGEVERAPSIPGKTITLRGLDKLTGEIATFEAPVGGETHYGRLLIEARACYARPEASSAPESTAFLQIYDTKHEPAALAFSGWMFASSPALSAMDHVRYDVWVLNCKTS